MMLPRAIVSATAGLALLAFAGLGCRAGRRRRCRRGPARVQPVPRLPHHREQRPQRRRPEPHNVVGRRAASIEGFRYRRTCARWVSRAMSGPIDNLRAYLRNPKEVAPQGIMSFPGLRNDQQLNDGSPICAPRRGDQHLRRSAGPAATARVPGRSACGLLGHHLAPGLDRDLRRVAVQMGDEHGADHLEELALLLDHALQPRGEGPDQAIGQQHAEEGADQRAADHLAEHRRRLVDRRHGLDHAEHGRDDAERGQRIRHASAWRGRGASPPP